MPGAAPHADRRSGRPFDAADWIDYALGWARRQRPKCWDWEQAAIDGLTRAWRTYDAARWRTRHEAHLKWSLRGAAADLRRRHGRAKRSGRTRRLTDADAGRLASRECGPMAMAMIGESTELGGT